MSTSGDYSFGGLLASLKSTADAAQSAGPHATLAVRLSSAKKIKNTGTGDPVLTLLRAVGLSSDYDKFLLDRFKSDDTGDDYIRCIWPSPRASTLFDRSGRDCATQVGEILNSGNVENLYRNLIN